LIFEIQQVGESSLVDGKQERRRLGYVEIAALLRGEMDLSAQQGKPAESNDIVLGPYAGTSVGLRKEKKLSLRFSLSILSKAHETADLISSISRGFMAW